MDIDYLGESMVEQLVKNQLVKTVADLYSLTYEQLLSLDRVGPKSANNLIQAILLSKQQPLSRLLTGLGIELLGQVAATQLAKEFNELSSLLSEKPETLKERVAHINGFGTKITQSLFDYLENPDQRALLAELVSLQVSRPEPQPVAVVDGTLFGKSFCVTGVLSKKRDVVQEEIRAAGGDVHDKMKKGTHYLVAGEKVGQSKLKAAEKFGATVIDETLLNQMINGVADSVDQEDEAQSKTTQASLFN